MNDSHFLFEMLSRKEAKHACSPREWRVPVNYGLKPHSDKSATCEVAGLELKKKQNSKTISTGQELSKLFGVDFWGYEEEAMELLMQIDSSRHARRTESNTTIKENKFKGTQKLKGLANGTREGILVVWDRRVWKGESLQIGIHTLTCRFEGQLQGFDCHITGVNAPNWDNERREICYKKKILQEKSTAMMEFSDFIEDTSLIDLQLEGGAYTWYRGDTYITALRTARILISDEWDNCFSNIKQSLLQRMTCICCIALWSYFKFDNWCLKTDRFVERVMSWWTSFYFLGKPNYCWTEYWKTTLTEGKLWRGHPC
ncbi:hypothetical protein H5410_061084 [Solanum commersonii]|uniref:Uncharacterized protein n=1 Tax=Solanum commersonii TaxID=4109 RepID=A0A9J5W8I3_SOLCO|nr:hypothetical protein H5410_061084 [Solanum commersonii]